jgi:hypothetical protein
MKKLFAAFIGLLVLSASIVFADDRYVDSCGCITDTKTGLTWTKDTDLTEGKASLNKAMHKIYELNLEKLCGLEWHIPTSKELRAIFDSYPNLKGDLYWIQYKQALNDSPHGTHYGINRKGEIVRDSRENHVIAVGSK